MAQYRAAGAKVVVYDYAEEYTEMWGVNDPSLLVQAVQDHGMVRIRDPVATAESMDAYIKEFCRLQGAVFVGEEMGSLVQGRIKLPPYLSWLVRLGRHRSLGYVVTAQAVTLIPTLIRSNARFIAAFNFYSPTDLRWFSEFLPGDVVEGIRTLPQFQYYLCDMEAQEFNVSVTVPR